MDTITCDLADSSKVQVSGASLQRSMQVPGSDARWLAAGRSSTSPAMLRRRSVPNPKWRHRNELTSRLGILP